jgi:acetyl esterase/lipase
MMARAYLGDRYDALVGDPRVSPLKAVKSGLPPQYILCGTADFLLKESKSMAEACKAAGVEHELDIVEEMPHGFIQIWMLSAAAAAQTRMYEFMRRYI